ncbi:ABC transporter substrate-binding protein [Prescottella sp. R16]|uniref:ABC transporter substrate-binding protein n=1 Tax=Prescottella sp. R16 TaxID=3064529 RepID=UPI00272EA553|nr:ABC transporter substrate-binding protein [Prescottella sp. R16]
MKTTLTAAGIVALTLATTGCGTPVHDDTAASPNVISIENCGRTLEFDTVPIRAIGLSPSQTELLVELGVADRLVGQAQTGLSDLPDDVVTRLGDVPVLSTDAPPVREVLLDAAPDFVFAPTEYEFTAQQGFASIDQLRQAGATAFIATGGCSDRRTTATVDDLFTDLTALGAVFDRADRATELVTQGQRRLDAVDAGIGSGPVRSVAQVYVEGSSLSVIGAGVESDIIARAGGRNVFSPDEKMFGSFFTATISPEELARRNPDALVFAVSDAAHRDATIDYLRTTFPTMTAVHTNRLIAVPASNMFPGTLGNIDAVETVAHGLA